MGRVYEAAFSGVNVSAVQDILSLQSTANMAVKILEIVLGQTSLSTVENLRLTFRRLSGAYTIGSGGSLLTPRPHLFGDAAATATVRANDTTQNTGGTSVTLRGEVFNEVNGYQYLAIPDKEIILPPSQAFVLSLDTAPTGTRAMSGAITFEELF